MTLSGRENAGENANASADEDSTNPADQSSDTKSSAQSKSGAESDGSKSASETDNQSHWTISDDLLLRGMKESTDNLSWVDIGKSLNRGKNDVKARWKMIKDQTDADVGANTEPQECQSAEASAQNDSSKTCEAESSEPGLSKKPRKRKEKTGNVSQAAKSTPTPPDEEHDGILSGEEASSESSSRDHDENESDYGLDEGALQKRYLYRDLYGCLYPPDIRLEPDSILNEEDCATLATIASKYEQGRLLEMQANFLNAAGRRIPISYLREKLLNAQCLGEDDEQNKIASVKKWIDQVQGR